MKRRREAQSTPDQLSADEGGKCFTTEHRARHLIKETLGCVRHNSRHRIETNSVRSFDLAVLDVD